MEHGVKNKKTAYCLLLTAHQKLPAKSLLVPLREAKPFGSAGIQLFASANLFSISWNRLLLYFTNFF
jgi:hypothetical protein